MKTYLKCFLLFTGFLSLSNTVRSSNNLVDTTLRVASIFQSNMVVQQDKPFVIWGYAFKGQPITISASWTNKITSVIVDGNGSWKGKIDVPKAIPGNFKSHSITLKNGDKSIVLDNLLIGDVWFASGQSNMQYSLKSHGDGVREGVPEYEKVIASANYPAIRLFNTELDFKAEPAATVKGGWMVCNPDNVRDFSAVGYFYGQELHNKLNIPIGIILSSIGASTAEAWTRREVLEADPVLKEKYIIPYDQSPQAKQPVTSDFTFEKVAMPTLLYNAMIHPFAGLSIKGWIWYQGESNRTDGKLYTRLLTAMIKCWRQDFAQGDLPFYYVQVAPYFWDKDFLDYDYAIFREAQSEVRNLKNTGMAVLLDDGEPKNLHPRNKKPVGLRLAKIALNNTYGNKQLQYLGPQYKKVKIQGNQVKIIFNKKSLGSGLNTSNGKSPQNFYLAGEDRKFYEANAVIEGNKIILQSAQVATPHAVRYAFTNAAITNLQNKEGLPAEQFRTDKWE